MFAHVLRAFGWKSKVNVLVLGFYDRGNLGDELYKEALPAVIRAANPDIDVRFDFKCTDDVGKIPEGTDAVLCGGGDIINAYFMNKIAALCETYVGPIYAVSVGIPYTDDAKYLKIFDHVYVRSSGDYQVAAAEVGAENVTQIADAVFALNLKSMWSFPAWCDQINVGIALAAPYFCALPQLIDDLENLCKLLAVNKAKIHLFAFNTYALNPSECDVTLVEELVKRLEGAATIEVHTSRAAVLKHFQRMDVALCMRYHSVVLAMTFGVPFVALYSTPKVERLLLDAGEPLNAHVKLPCAAASNVPELLAFRLGRATKRRAPAFAPQPKGAWSKVSVDRDYKVVIHKPETSPWQLVAAQVERMLKLQLGDSVDARRRGPFPLGAHDPTRVARVICYGVTGDAGHDCIWGLSQNMREPTFVLEEAVKYIYNYHKAHHGCTDTALPRLMVKRTCLFNVDPYYAFSPANKVHRSGWSFVLSHLMNLDACRLGRRSSLLLDTYVDRTFHWGMETLQTIGATPYTTPWIGIIHHTFDTSHSDFNCKRLFENPVFLRALRHCLGLVALSDYLATQMKEALAHCAPWVPVAVIYHPTQTVPKRFAWGAYMRNADRKLVQIGAWLRRPYSIYALRLPKRCTLRKAALRGKNMDAYFPPSGLETTLGGLSADDVAYTCCGVSRGGTTNNKFVEGLLDVVAASIGSVEVLGPLDDEAYDDLLSQNVVFLDLVDCSAVNTVIECIVRNTPVVVNRHPALEEILGESYPGFYTDAQEQVPRLLTHACLKAIHQHLVRMDKKRFEISTFLGDLQAFAVAVA